LKAPEKDAAMSEHQIPHKKTHTRFQAAILLLSFSTPHNALGWGCTGNPVTITTVILHLPRQLSLKYN